MDGTFLLSEKIRFAATDERCNLDDRIDISRALNGDTDAFKQLVLKYENLVAATVIGMLGSGPEAEDVGQEVFIRLYRSLHKFRGESALGTYLTRIALNLCFNELRKRQRQRKLYANPENHPIENFPAKQDSELQLEASELVRRGLQRVPARYRAVIVLRLIEGYSTAEVAHILEVPIGTVLSRLARGQQKLRQILNPLCREKSGGSGEKDE